MSAEKLRQEALALPLDERAALARDLLLSLNEAADPGTEEAWAEEIGRLAEAGANGPALPRPTRATSAATCSDSASM